MHSTSTTRYYYMDSLRAIALIVGVIYHAGISFSTVYHDVWPTADTQSSIVVDYGLFFFHTFRMPLFFLIAGFFAHLLMKKRGSRGFIKHRSLHIALPFLIFFPVGLLSVMAIFIHGANNMPVSTPTIDAIREGVSSSTANQDGNSSLPTLHLWFLYYLAIFCCLAAVFNRIVPTNERLRHLITHPIALLVVLPLFNILFLHEHFIPHPAPDQLQIEPWAIGFYGTFFLVGWVVFTKPALLEFYQRYWPYLAVSVVASYTLFAMALPDPPTMEEALAMQYAPVALDIKAMIRLVTTSVLAWHATLLCLALGQCWLNKASALMRYLSEGSYWVYIVHMPIVYYLQLHFHTLDLPIFVELVLISGITLSFAYLSYAILVRNTPIGWLLNGRRKK